MIVICIKLIYICEGVCSCFIVKYLKYFNFIENGLCYYIGVLICFIIFFLICFVFCFINFYDLFNFL